jgi:hypothetical protein
MSGGTGASKRFQLILIKPSHYDEDGYVVQWLRSTMPSNSLAAVYSLAKGAAERELLGSDLPIDVHAMDETNTRVRPREIARRIANNGGLGLVGIIGVQSNEFPRAVDIARSLREAGVQVLIGGFHVSGCLAMLNETPSDIKAAQELGISIYAGEAEEGLDEVILDAKRSELRPIYDHMKHLPDIGEMGLAAFPAGRFRQAHNRQCHELRCRPRLPLPVLVLHHHQRAGPQVTLSLPRLGRADPAHELRSGCQPLLHHR